MKDFVSKILQNELVDFVANYAENHSKFLTALVARFAKPENNKKKNTFIKEFDDIVKNHSDSGFIDYRNSYGFESDMANFLGALSENSKFFSSCTAWDSILHFTKKIRQPADRRFQRNHDLSVRASVKHLDSIH